jgi:hypothetical protein
LAQNLELRNITEIWKYEFQDCSEAPKEHTFRNWYHIGCKYGAIVSGGSVYFLVLIAGLGLRTTLSDMSGDTPWQVADILRAPPQGKINFISLNVKLICIKDSNVRDLIRQNIVPTIAFMQEKLPLTVSPLFKLSLFTGHILGNEMRCSDLNKSDMSCEIFVKR